MLPLRLHYLRFNEEKNERALDIFKLYGKVGVIRSVWPVAIHRPTGSSDYSVTFCATLRNKV